MAQLMPLPLAVSCFSEVQIGFTFLVLAHLGSPGKRAVKWVCVCVCYIKVANFLENLEMSGNLTAVVEMSGDNLVTENCLLLTLCLGLHQCS